MHRGTIRNGRASFKFNRKGERGGTIVFVNFQPLGKLNCRELHPKRDGKLNFNDGRAFFN